MSSLATTTSPLQSSRVTDQSSAFDTRHQRGGGSASDVGGGRVETFHRPGHCSPGSSRALCEFAVWLRPDSDLDRRESGDDVLKNLGRNAARDLIDWHYPLTFSMTPAPRNSFSYLFLSSIP